MHTRSRIALLALLAVPLGAEGALALTPGADLARCQRKITTQTRAFAKIVAKKVHICTDKVAFCKLANEIDAVDPTACLAATASVCGGLDTTLDTLQTRRKTAIDRVCGALIPLADMTPYVGGLGFLNVAADCGAVSTANLTDCLLDETRCAAEREVFRRDPRALDSLTEAGVAASFPCVGP